MRKFEGEVESSSRFMRLVVSKVDVEGRSIDDLVKVVSSRAGLPDKHFAITIHMAASSGQCYHIRNGVYYILYSYTGIKSLK